MAVERRPNRLRLCAYAAATAVLLYFTQAPSWALPQVHAWDKAEHALSWFALTVLGLVLFPRRAGRVAAFALAFGVLVEVLQAILPFGRDPQLADIVADAAGVAAALAILGLSLRMIRARA